MKERKKMFLEELKEASKKLKELYEEYKEKK